MTGATTGSATIAAPAVAGTTTLTLPSQSGTLALVSDISGTTINSVTFDNSNSGAASGSTFNGNAALTVSANTLGAASTSGSYSDPAWITALSFAKLTSKPTTASGYGITDAVTTSGAQTIGGTKTFSSDIVLTGATSGSATIAAPAVAGTTTLTLPSQSGTLALLSDISGGSGITIQEDGSALAARQELNFNYGVLATDNSGSSRTDVNVSLSTAEAGVTSDVSMSAANTFYDGGSVTLAAGTWMIVSNATVESPNNTAFKVTGKIWDGSTVYSAAEGAIGSMGGSSKGYVNFSMNSIITLSATTTVKASYTSTAASCLLKAAPGDNNSGTNGKTTSIRAVRIK